MVSEDKNFRPNWASPPGDTISDLIEERKWKQIELARRLGISQKHVNRLIAGKVLLTEEMASRLATVFGSTERFWLRREALYREHSARLKREELYPQMVDWLDKFPIKELKDAGVLSKLRLGKTNKPKLVEELLRFFGINSPDQWESEYVAMKAFFRRRNDNDTNIGAVTAWLRLGEIVAERYERELKLSGKTFHYNRKKFRTALREIRTLTVLDPAEFQPKIMELCLRAGVFLVFVPAIPKARVSGMTRWWRRDRPLIQLSLFGKSNDRFWFTFFHETAHLLFHDKKKQKIHLDENYEYATDDPVEIEANEWASEILIPQIYEPNLRLLQSKAAVRNFASQIEIHPGIVVGQLQHRKLIPYSWMNDLKDTFTFVDE